MKSAEINKILESNGIVILNFGAYWNDECQRTFSLLSRLSQTLEEQDTIVQVDWENQKLLSRRFGVFGVPTLLIFKQRKEVARFSGSIQWKELITKIQLIKEKHE